MFFLFNALLMDNCLAVILAAGKGTRMKSTVPKVLHPLAGWPMAKHVIEAVKETGIPRAILIVGHQAGRVRESLGDDVEYVEQADQLGTGHAVLQTRSVLQGWSGDMLVLCGDTPLVSAETLSSLIQRHRSVGAEVTLLTGNGGYRKGAGRILRDEAGNVAGIREEKEATAGQRAIQEWNTGIYCFRVPWLWGVLDRLPLHSNGEYYLTDVVELALGVGDRVNALVASDAGEFLGINSRVELAVAEGILRQRIRERLMLDGVTIMDPPSAFVDRGVQVGADSVIYPNTLLLGATSIGAGCLLGPNTQISNSVIGDECEIKSSVIEQAVLESHIDVGPFSHVRAGVHIESGVHVGNYVELKASRLGRGTKVGHFSYVGDAMVGQDVNIGAGTITANFDGNSKHQTIVEDGAFIGSDSTLVAPVRVGAGAITGAGSVVTKDVPAGAVAYGVPAHVRREKGE